MTKITLYKCCIYSIFFNIFPCIPFQHFGRVQQREDETQKGHIPLMFGSGLKNFKINPIFMPFLCPAACLKQR